MKTVFLIINYNDYETTKILLDNIKDYQVIDKILVVDNNSTDLSFTQLKALENSKLEIIKNNKNSGYGSGINFGSKYLINIYKECYIIVSNADVVISKEDDITSLLTTFNSSTAIVGPIIKEVAGINRGWKIPTPVKDSLLNIIYIHKFLRPLLLFYKDTYYNKDIVTVEALSGCFFIINSNDLKEVDFFDENVFLYYEENIIAKKLQRINKEIKINTKVEVFHNHSVTIDKNINRIKKYKELKKSQLYFHKNYNKANIFDIIFLYITSRITLGFLYLVNIFR